MQENQQPTERASIQQVEGLIRILLELPRRWLVVVALVVLLSMFEVSRTGEGETIINFRLTTITAALIALAWLPVVLKIVALAGGGLKTPAGEVSTTGLLGKVELSSPEELGKVPQQLLRESPEQAIKELLIRRPAFPDGLAEIFIGTATIERLSGFVVSERGYLISMHFSEKREVLVRLSGRDDILRAKVIASSPETLLSLLKLPDDVYPALKLTSSFNLGDHVFVASLITGITDGTITGVGGISKFVLPDGRTTVVSGIIEVEGVPSQKGGGGSPVLNEQGEVVGVRIAGSSDPPRILAVESDKFLSEFPQILG